jgi:hypothetical protein
MLLGASLLLASCASVNEPVLQPLTLEQIVAMTKAGKDAPTIINEIKVSKTLYDVTASQYAKLSRDGVPDAVLDYMQQGQMRLATSQARREAYSTAWLYGNGWGWGYGGPWAGRQYLMYVNGRPHTRTW